MKILIIPSWYPNSFNSLGGIFFKEQAEALVKYGHDVSVLSDIVHFHSYSVGMFALWMQKTYNIFYHYVDKIVLTTPNAFCLNNFRFALKNIEFINTDHRFWFTPYTLSKIAVDAGFEIEKIGFYEHGVLGRRQILRKLFLSKYFTFKDTLIIELRR